MAGTIKIDDNVYWIHRATIYRVKFNCEDVKFKRKLEERGDG